MRYQDGNIILNENEMTLLSTVLKKDVEQTSSVLAFIYSMELIKEEVNGYLTEFKDDEKFIAIEKELRAAIRFTNLVCDRFRSQAVIVARQAGAEITVD